MQIEYVNPDGSARPLGGQCITIDSIQDTFVVTLHSMQGVDPERVRDLLQHFMKVLDIAHAKRTYIVLC
jgi:hypothetical protein